MLLSITDFMSPVNGSNDTAVIYSRVSGRPQEWNGNLSNQTRFMHGVCQQHGLHVVATVAGVEWGRSLSIGREHLRHAISLALSCKAVVVSFSLLRLVRQRYASETELRASDVAWLRDSPVTFLTWLSPDASLSDIRSAEIRLGLSTRNPVDESLIADILSQRKLGISFGDIAKRYGIPKTTVQRMVENRSKH